MYRAPSDRYHLLSGSFAHHHHYPSPTSHFKLLIRRTTIYLGQCSDRQTLLRLVIESWSPTTCCCPPSSSSLIFSRLMPMNPFPFHEKTGGREKDSLSLVSLISLVIYLFLPIRELFLFPRERNFIFVKRELFCNFLSFVFLLPHKVIIRLEY